MTNSTDADGESTHDSHYVMIKGRRWRATDPELPANVSELLRHELMSARRAVGVALRSNDRIGEQAARDRVHQAKVALGERGTPWWQQSATERRERWHPLVQALSS